MAGSNAHWSGPPLPPLLAMTIVTANIPRSSARLALLTWILVIEIVIEIETATSKIAFEIATATATESRTKTGTEIEVETVHET